MLLFSKSRSIIPCLLAVISISCGCENRTVSAPNVTRMVVFSDVHFDPFYDPELFQSLIAAEAGEWESIYKTSTITEPSAWGSDTNYPLFVKALSGVRQNMGTSPLIVFPGDFLSHNFARTFYDLYGSQDVAAMQAFTRKTVAFFTAQARAYFGKIPVIFALGNNDSYEGDYMLAPNSPFLSDTAEIFFTNLLSGTADHQAFLRTFKAGGYYIAQPIGADIVVIVLNTVFFTNEASAVAGIGNAIQNELSWLESALSSAKSSGKKVWLLMHVPPGADIKKTGDMDGGSGRITTAKMMMQANYQESLLKILSNYRDIINFSLAGHTHMDEYRNILGDTSTSSEILEISPSISPRDGNDPAFKVITFSGSTFEPIDYHSNNYDLAALPGQFNSFYTFSTSYSMQGLLVPALTGLVPELATSYAKQNFYRGSYYSGHSSSSPITDINWPVYWCGIGKMLQQNVVDCVNTY